MRAEFGFNGLAATAQAALEEDPFRRHVFVFHGQRGDLIKFLWWRGDGLCLLVKRLGRGRFVWPQASNGLLAHVLVIGRRNDLVFGADSAVNGPLRSIC